ncbi:MAG TPA: hypothetical protein DCM23_01420, partial [Firmicutes bacterium]|nr:hypothetical protein [Bacillota bacterium]
VLNNRPNNFSDETIARIIRIAHDNDYHPNGIAKSLATRKSHTIGIIVPDISNTFFSESVKSLQLELDKKGYAVLLCSSEEKFANDYKYIKLLAARQVDGLILTVAAETMANNNWVQIKDLLASLKLPTVLYDRYYPGVEPKVYVDNKQGAYELTQYLLENGHTDIGLITGPLDLISAQGRLAGVNLALQEAGLTLKPEHVINANYDIESGRQGAKQLLGNVSAIFAFNDLQAYGVMDAAREMNMVIPRDVSLVGFDDIFYSAVLDMRLTTVSQPIKEMAKELCFLMIKAIEDDEPISNEISIPGKLVRRDSVAKFRSING